MVIFIDSEDRTRIVNIGKVEKEKSPISVHTLYGDIRVVEDGHPSICSDADVNIEVRHVPKKCKKNCCEL